MKNNPLLGGLTHQQFLDEYWQQKPLLIRQAFPDISAPFSAEELAGLCCDTEVPARIIIENGLEKNTPWQVIQSPLEEQHFLDLPDSHWTLLVNDLERYYPEHLELLNHFRFIPDWRIDDLMVSYAPEGGSVGPHIDEYDVFLIQASGKRHWMLDSSADKDQLLPNVELEILSEFNTQQEWTLEAGDMLYLPPNLAHYGVAENECMTYSVGFRSPSQQELLESWLYSLTQDDRISARYKDAGRKTQVHSGKIETEDIEALKKHLLQGVNSNNDAFTDWLGSYLTTPKSSDQHELEEYVADELLDNSTDYFRTPNKRIAWIEHPDHIALFIDGKSSKWGIDVKEAVIYICGKYQYSTKIITSFERDSSTQQLLEFLINEEVLRSNS